MQELSRQLEESASQIDGKINKVKSEAEEAKEAIRQGLANIKDELGRKILESANDLSSKYDEKLDKSAETLSNQIEEKLENKLLDVKMGMDEMEKNVADALETEKSDREKLADDTKMALEEEKMLRAQDIGIIRLICFTFPLSLEQLTVYLYPFNAFRTSIFLCAISKLQKYFSKTPFVFMLSLIYLKIDLSHCQVIESENSSNIMNSD